MKQADTNLGDIRSVHRPVTWRIWLMAMVSLGPLLIFGLGIVLLIDGFAHGRKADPGIAIWLGRLAVIGLILALVAGFLISEVRRWYPTRSVRLEIFAGGFTYREREIVHTCPWADIRDITHRTVMIHSKHAAPRRASIIRSVIKKDGTMITLAETLNLHKLTALIKAGNASAR